jgi:tetratricopeptide (TPR) repeat protein
VTDIAQLKRRAADLESGKDLDRAIQAYREIVQLFERGAAEPIDIPLYNRLGDLLLKKGALAEAVDTWERALDLYAEGGFNNPAIALANKILRSAPERTPVHLKLGRLLAAKGFRVEARHHFVEYASRMRQLGDHDAAFRALKECADKVPDAHDVRLMLADQLVEVGRAAEATEQLQRAHLQLTREGKTAEAELVAARLRTLDPAAELAVAAQRRTMATDGLVFLDVGAANFPRPTGVFDGSVFLSRESIAMAAAPSLSIDAPPPSAPALVEPAQMEPAQIEPAPVESDSIPWHQRQVESAARSGDRARLSGAFVALGDALMRTGAPERASAVYQRVLEIDPNQRRASTALAAITGSVENEEIEPLGEWRHAGTGRTSRQLMVAERPPGADYELGVAYREMGLVDQAIAAFQQAGHAPAHRLRALEALGRCFVQKGQVAQAQRTLEEALAEPGATDEGMVGVLLLLGQVTEALGAPEEARRYYQRVFAVDARFRDVVDRLHSLERTTP